ncbi:MAG TPA: POTRA domain-containing protein [Bryobacteraceae bacterium]|jgi:outer membrane protein assembly factor BamA
MSSFAILHFGAALLGCAVLVAQPAPSKYALESLRVTGNRQIPTERIVAASGLKIGSVVAKADFDAARVRLNATGAFENAGYEYKPAADGKGYDAVIEVIEVNELFPFRFEDLPASEESLRAAVKRVEPIFEDRIPATAVVLNRYVKGIEQYLAENGASGFQVTGKLNAEAPGDLAVLFRPAAPRANIAEVRFVGNHAIETAALLRTINAVAIGIAYSEAAIRQRLDASIRRLYETHGLIRVAFPTVATEKAKNIDGIVVIVTVNEGQIFNLGTVRFTGVPAGDSSAVNKLADFKKGTTVNFDEVNATLERIHKRLRNSGYLRTSSTVTRNIQDENRTVDLAVAVEPGPRYVFGKLQIDGLDILTEPAIRQMWGSLEGKPFNPDFPDSFLARVKNENVLDNLGKTSSETRVDEASKRVDVTLHFSGAGPQPKKRIPDPPPAAVQPPEI